ncbi:phosphoglycerate mutase [Naviculisporaceae sp. PSN 640]
MSLEVIYVTRHGFRSNWLVDPSNGNYTSTLKTPTGIAADPPLTAHGVDQARELGEKLFAVDPPIERVYSSCYYRCLQTIEPFTRKAVAQGKLPPSGTAGKGDGKRGVVRGETGLGEWYGSAPFEHPVPATPEVLESFFPALLEQEYRPAVVPTRNGESIDELHDRVATTMEALISECDRDGVRSVLLCSHAAVVIALGRVLTGVMPENVEAEDFRAFTCGLSVYRRRKNGKKSTDTDTGADTQQQQHQQQQQQQQGSNATPSARNANPQIQHEPTPSPSRVPQWRGGRGILDGWDCELNSDCSHLSGGEERGWRFAGDESFGAIKTSSGSILDSGDLGVVVEGKKGEVRVRSKV